MQRGKNKWYQNDNSYNNVVTYTSNHLSIEFLKQNKFADKIYRAVRD